LIAEKQYRSSEKFFCTFVFEDLSGYDAHQVSYQEVILLVF